jgi:hypothetical protein
MFAKYDVFRISEGGPLWCGSAATLEEAQERAKTLERSDRCDHLIVDQATGMQISVKMPQPTPNAA